MPSSPATVAELQALLATRFPSKVRRTQGVVSCGVPAVDEALGGGLAIGRLTEIVSSAPGTGGQTLLAQLLRTTRAARQRVVLIDGANGFVAHEVPQDALRHLVWVRAHDVAEALAAADIVVRDGNYAVVMLDLRGLPERTLLKTSSSVWHRLRTATDDSPTAVMVQTTSPLVPAVPWRLRLTAMFPLTSHRLSRAQVVAAIGVEVLRGSLEREEKSA